MTYADMKSAVTSTMMRRAHGQGRTHSTQDRRQLSRALPQTHRCSCTSRHRKQTTRRLTVRSAYQYLQTQWTRLKALTSHSMRCSLKSLSASAGSLFRHSVSGLSLIQRQASRCSISTLPMKRLSHSIQQTQRK